MRCVPLFLFAFVLILTVSCKKEKEKEKVVFVKTEIEIENLFEIEEIIPLDVPDGETLVSIYRLQTFEGNYYLLDVDFGTLLKFSPEGKTLAKIGKLGEGPEDLLDYSDKSQGQQPGLQGDFTVFHHCPVFKPCSERTL